MTELTAAKRVSAPGPFLRAARRMAERLLVPSGSPSVGSVRWGALRRTRPISRNFGYDRGKPIDRGYIEEFLSQWSSDIKGVVLEVKDPGYIRRFGGDRVSRFEVLDVDPGNREATIVDDLNSPRALPAETFDCIILTQTLQYVFDLGSAVRGLHQSLKPGGVLLLTLPGISPVHAKDATWYWNFTDVSSKKLLVEHFPSSEIEIANYGNLLSATAFLYGLSCDELRPGELRVRDANYPVIISARARKPAA